MPESTSTSSRARTLYLVGTVLAAAALALGLWDVLVERDGGGWLWGAGFPAALLLLMLLLYRRTPSV